MLQPAEFGWRPFDFPADPQAILPHESGCYDGFVAPASRFYRAQPRLQLAMKKEEGHARATPFAPGAQIAALIHAVNGGYAKSELDLYDALHHTYKSERLF